ncbi:C39 family peptidase [Chloroflexi bacterium TSY]|nr:C39 family peptidase [Chloroflexi bacterium TSY]
MLLNNFNHWQQRHEDDCLVACCKMVLSYLGIEKSESWLWQLLSSGDVTPFPHVKILADELGLNIEYGYGRDDLTLFAPYLETGLPVIVSVDADRSDEWPYVDNHAVVVVGFDDTHVYVNDPALSDTPLAVDIDLFLLEWSNRGYQYAVLSLTEIE